MVQGQSRQNVVRALFIQNWLTSLSKRPILTSSSESGHSVFKMIFLYFLESCNELLGPIVDLPSGRPKFKNKQMFLISKFTGALYLNSKGPKVLFINLS
jgi:hypothetical protein